MEEAAGLRVQVVIKCPITEDMEEGNYTMSLPSSCTILDVKGRLSRDHPCKPAVEDQRLVFRGSVLEDETLLSVLCASDRKADALVLHMALRSGRYRRESVREGKVQRAHERVVQPEPVAMPAAEEVAGGNLRPPVLYGYVNRDGNMVYADVSNAVIFDGKNFFQMRSTPSLLVGSFGIQLSAPPTHARRAEPPRQFRFRLGIDLSRVYNFVFRLLFIVLIFAQHLSRVKLAMLCAIVSLVFLVQNDVFALPAFLQMRQEQRAEAPNAGQEDTGEDQIVEAAAGQRGVSVGNVVGSFFTSLIPGYQQVDIN